MVGVEVVPAILVKSREELLEQIARVRESVSRVHIDIMDNVFVPNRTLGLESLGGLPNGISYEFHWMVKKPEKWISKVKGDHLHLVHAETITDWGAVKRACASSGGRLGLVLNPETPIEKLEPYLKDVSRVLVMAVHPGFYGQKYIPDVEGKIRALRARFPKLEIEVDGGVNAETAERAGAAGADVLAAASAVFSAKNASEARERIREISEAGERGSKRWADG
ncbi:MAG: ribulose-phosphate 3-epimerase [Candidatus Micrarchaeota archaeon]